MLTNKSSSFQSTWLPRLPYFAMGAVAAILIVMMALREFRSTRPMHDAAEVLSKRRALAPKRRRLPHGNQSDEIDDNNIIMRDKARAVLKRMDDSILNNRDFEAQPEQGHMDLEDDEKTLTKLLDEQKYLGFSAVGGSIGLMILSFYFKGAGAATCGILCCVTLSAYFFWLFYKSFNGRSGGVKVGTLVMGLGCCAAGVPISLLASGSMPLSSVTDGGVRELSASAASCLHVAITASAFFAIFLIIWMTSAKNWFSNRGTVLVALGTSLTLGGGACFAVAQLGFDAENLTTGFQVENLRGNYAGIVLFGIGAVLLIVTLMVRFTKKYDCLNPQ